MGEATRSLAHLAEEDFSGLPFDQEWLYSMSLLAETAALLSDIDSADALYDELAPWATLNAVDVAEGIRGSAHATSASSRPLASAGKPQRTTSTTPSR